ncbi:hypothetical protein HAX54_012586 [Datura stramonium]|uniref:Uncharacterized protein n=1 Tax=Datura stramonium TaxID=4076 RepID=A0ABS8Y582_DATST|nr:hypothetical protein [Datura stramonium]
MSDFSRKQWSSERSNEVDGGILAFFGKLAFRLVLGFVRVRGRREEVVPRRSSDATWRETLIEVQPWLFGSEKEERMLDGGISVREGVTAAALWCAGGLLFFRVVGFAGR